MASTVSAYEIYRQKRKLSVLKSRDISRDKKKKLRQNNGHAGVFEDNLLENLQKPNKIKRVKHKKQAINKKLHNQQPKLENMVITPKSLGEENKMEPELSVSKLLSQKSIMPSSSVRIEENGSVRSDDSGASVEFIPVQTDSAEEGLKALEWLTAPYKAEDFLNQVWEKSPLHISRRKASYYKDVISTTIIDKMLRTENIVYTRNIDITSYADGMRETHNPVGRAHPHAVWDYYLNGCSIRLLNPQTFIPRLQLLNATLQEFFNSFVGANAYLTPPDSQGFAPHYDDIEALVMQVEGKKHWRVYRPRSENEVLPRVSSKNFDQHEIGEPVLEVTLEAGDMLYFPRGFIHQGFTVDGEHSLHVTVSFYQKHSFADLLEKLLPAALQEAITENVELRRGLPFDIYDNFGFVNSDVNTPRKQEISNLIESLIDKVKHHLPIDAAVDEMAKRFQHTALPPILTDMERRATVYGDSDVMVENGKVTRRVELELNTRIRLLRKNILRMVNEEEGIRLYFYTENSLDYEGHEPQYLEIDEKFASAVETLIIMYPEYVSVENLNIEDESDKLQIANDLWENGLIMTEYPLETVED